MKTGLQNQEFSQGASAKAGSRHPTHLENFYHPPAKVSGRHKI